MAHDEKTGGFDIDESKETPMTEKDALKLTQQLQQREKDLSKLAKDLAAKENIDADTWFKGIVQSVGYSQGIAGQALKALEKPITDSISTYKNFEALLEGDQILRYPAERVQGTKDVFQTYWSLLGDTTKQLAEMIAEVDNIIDIVQECKDAASSRKNKIPPIDSIRECVEELNEFYKNANKVGELATKWQNLGSKADNERTAWKKIEEEAKKNMKKNFSKTSILKGVLVGLATVAGVALICTGIGIVGGVPLLAPLASILAGAFVYADIAVGVVLLLGGVGFSIAGGLKLYKSYSKFKCATDGVKAATASHDHIIQISETMNRISTDSKVIEAAIRDLNENYTAKMKKKTNRMTKNLKKLDENSNDDDRSFKLKSIFKNIQTLEAMMVPFKQACETCLKTTVQARKNIVEMSVNKASSKNK